jgi:hypothetical protein
LPSPTESYGNSTTAGRGPRSRSPNPTTSRSSAFVPDQQVSDSRYRAVFRSRAVSGSAIYLVHHPTGL